MGNPFEDLRQAVVVRPMNSPGPQGAAAPHMKVKYSADGTSWHNDPVETDRYLSFSTDNGITWSDAIYFNNLSETLEWVEKARQWAENPENDEVESGQYSALHHALQAKKSEIAAGEYAIDAAESATEAFGAAAPDWDSETVYSYNDVVSFDNGHTYRCIGTDVVGAAHAPNIDGVDNVEEWTRITVALNGYFELDEYGNYMPMIAPVTSDIFMLDENGDIMCRDDDALDEQFIDNEAKLRDMIPETGDDPVSITIYTNIPITSGDLTIPSNVHLHFENNGKLSPADGITLTIEGSVSAGLWQVFGDSGTLAGPIMNDMIFPEWFGNDLSRTINAAGAHNTTIKISSPIIIDSDITIPSNIELDFARNGKLIAGTDVTVTLNCGIRTEPWQIFDGDGMFNGIPLVDTVYPEWWGAVGDGITDDTVALQAAADFCFQATREYLMLKTLRRTYLITSTLQIRCHADMSLSKIHSDASFSPSIKVGDDNTFTMRLYFKGPSLYNVTKTAGNGWGSSEVPYPEAVGIQTMNLIESNFSNTIIQNFGIGLQIAAKNTGNCYNTYNLGTLANNQKNLQIKPLNYGGWCNENYFEGGRFQFFGSETDNTNTRQIEIISEGTISTCNGNTFVKASLESDFCEYKVYLNGSYNTFIGCRWEGDSIPVAFYGSGERYADGNIFISGTNLQYLFNGCVELGNGQRYTAILGGSRLLSSIGYDGACSFRFYGDSLSPAIDNILNLGHSNYRWDTIYAATGTIQTSDKRTKTELVSIEDAERNVALKIKSMIGKFKFLDAIDKKGEDNARIHFGATAQDIAKAFESEGLDPHKYGMFCYDEWEADPENGIEAGNRYGIRYDELLAFLITAL